MEKKTNCPDCNGTGVIVSAEHREICTTCLVASPPPLSVDEAEYQLNKEATKRYSVTGWRTSLHPQIERERDAFIAGAKWAKAGADYQAIQQPVRKTLDEVKDEVAKQNGFNDWKTMDTGFDVWMSKQHDKAAELYAQSTKAVEPQQDRHGQHPEDYCHKCNRDNPRWYAPNEIFNLVTGTVGEGIMCPICFLEMAKAKGLGLIFTVENKEPQQGWVGVKELKPEKTGWYLTYSVKGGVQTELYEFKESRFLSGEDITHWMHRPEPPTPTNN